MFGSKRIPSSFGIYFRSHQLIETHVRVTLLRWFGKAMGNKNMIGHTEDGRTYKVEIHLRNRITLSCEDGALDMPSTKLYFVNGKGELRSG